MADATRPGDVIADSMIALIGRAMTTLTHFDK